jgi:organic hydroperoxide reductase OsmC/OhrA
MATVTTVAKETSMPDTLYSATATAHQGCPYSRATRGNITTELVLVKTDE